MKQGSDRKDAPAELAPAASCPHAPPAAAASQSDTQPLSAAEQDTGSKHTGQRPQVSGPVSTSSSPPENGQKPAKQASQAQGSRQHGATGLDADDRVDRQLQQQTTSAATSKHEPHSTQPATPAKEGPDEACSSPAAQPASVSEPSPAPSASRQGPTRQQAGQKRPTGPQQSPTGLTQADSKPPDNLPDPVAALAGSMPGPNSTSATAAADANPGLVSVLPADQQALPDSTARATGAPLQQGAASNPPAAGPSALLAPAAPATRSDIA